jgi:hypothetical protein
MISLENLESFKVIAGYLVNLFQEGLFLAQLIRRQLPGKLLQKNLISLVLPLGERSEMMVQHIRVLSNREKQLKKYPVLYME